MPTLTRRPVVSKITDNLVQAVSQVKVAAGYENDLTAEKFKRSGNGSSHGTVVVAKVDFEPAERQAVGSDMLWQHYQLTCFVAEDEDGEAEFDDLLDVVAADVKRAVMQDPTRGGIARQTDFLRGEPFDSSEDELGGVLLAYRVQYRTRLDNPFEQ
jgi:hypothetical protein